MPPLPSPLRATLGVIATVVEERRRLPDKALELPVLAISTALQMSLRAQQRYAAFTAKGDEVISGLRGVPDDPPSWATFDDLPTLVAEDDDPAASPTARRLSAFERAAAEDAPGDDPS
jgi:hypothetical protein